MIPTTAVSMLVAQLTGCYIEQDVLVTDAEVDLASLEPSFRYAYFREDPDNNRIHLRFTDYWNPCIADAQLQNQFRRNPSPADQSAAYASLMPRRAWAADVYLNVEQWPNRSQTDLVFDVIPQQEDVDGKVVSNYGLVCLLRQCPYEEQCDRCLPDQPGAVAGFSRTVDHLDADYFESNTSVDRIQQYASSGRVRIDVWNPAVRSSVLEDTGGDGALAPNATLSGRANLDMREFGQQTDAGNVRLDFTATVCEAMQASFTSDLARFERRDLNTYGPPGCSVGAAGASVYALGLLAVAFRRRRKAANGNQA